MLLKNKVILLISIFLFISCSKKVQINYPESKFDVIEKVTVNNPIVCQIKRKGIFSYEDRFNRVKFKGLLVKDCEDRFRLTVIGAFNQPAIIVSGDRNKLDVEKSEIENPEAYLGIFNKKNIDVILSILNYPLILPDNTYNMTVVDNFYNFSKGDITISVNENYKISKIKTKFIEIDYEYDENIKGLQTITPELILTVTFL
ncbi:MAG: hypothetical protein JG762_1056 [Deferribacteraceae bacterium]|jgi:hypothetical protein|nr:hypothetical protein [Deferribacteraceae bacterium]